MIAQIALSMLLVAAAGLFSRSLGNLRSVDLGFDPENLLLFRLNADQGDSTKQQRLAFFERVRGELARLPGVTAAAASDQRLLSGHMSTDGFSIRGSDPAAGEDMTAHRLVIDGDFLGTMRIPLRQGRAFGPQDTERSEPVAIINELFAETHFPGQEPVGKAVSFGGTERRIVGVCASALYTNASEGAPVTVYVPASQRVPRAMHFAVRSALPPAALVPAVRKAVAALDPTIPLTEISTQRAQFDSSLAVEQTFASLCASLGGLAVLLCCVGLYGLMTCNVTQRSVEIGVRMALGALPRDVARRTVSEALAMTAWGLAFGLPLAIGAGFAARRMLFDVTPYDPLALGGTVACMVAAAALAAWLPARRAARVDPITALRAE